MPQPPKGQRDLSELHLTAHAIDRFVERFHVDPIQAETKLRTSLRRARRLGRNAENRAVALLAVFESRPVVAIVQEKSCLTVLTWPQFEPRLKEFGRDHIPRKWGRFLRRINEEL
jgi:hypothetical protein